MPLAQSSRAALPSAPDLKAAVARILVGEGEETAGSGLLLVGGFIATCAHVVRAAIAADPYEGATLRIRFPHAGNLNNDRRNTADWARVARCGLSLDTDVAILLIDGVPPFESGWFLSDDLSNRDRLDVDCFGFGESFGGDGGTAEGRVPTNALAGSEATLYRRNTESAITVEPGFSGGPVYDRNFRVLGLLRRDSEIQGQQVARMIVGRHLHQVFLAAWQAERVRAPLGKELAPLIAAARQGVEGIRKATNAPRLPDAIETHLTALEQALADPAAIAEACEELRGIEERWGEAKREGLERCFPRLGLGNLANLIGSFAPKLKAAAVDGSAAVANDWDTNENLPHAAEVRQLLVQIGERLAALIAPMPGLAEEARRKLRSALMRLRRILYGHPLSLAEVDAVRAELERLDRDVFSVLIEECEVLLGHHAHNLPTGAIFRNRLADGSAGPEMVLLPTGSFLMGSADNEEERDNDEGPQHRVTIGYRFALGRYPVTVEEYRQFAEATKRIHEGGIWVWPKVDVDPTKSWRDPGFAQTERHPVVGVSWDDAKAYAEWLAGETNASYRLPSEAEWEYACRAGTTTRYAFGDEISTSQANFDRHKQGTTAVGTYPANAWGVHDMHGNVWEWVEDVWHGAYEEAPVDGSAWTVGAEQGARALRGGSWFNDPGYLRSAFRNRSGGGNRSSSYGFRLARTI